MFPRKYNKQNKFKRILLKLLNVYAYEKETLNIVNPDYKNSFGNIIKLNDRSFNFSQGYLNLTRKVEELDIFFRYAPNSSLYNSKGSWKRIVPGINKEQLILTCISSLKDSILYFLEENKLKLRYILFLITLSADKRLHKLIDTEEFEIVTHNSKISGNRGSYLECCDQAVKAKDLIFFIEYDYLFEKNCVDEMVLTFSRLSTLLKEDVITCPTDYSFFYDSLYKTSLFIGKKRWRVVGETLLTFMLSKETFEQNNEYLRKVGEVINEPFEKPHMIYIKRKYACTGKYTFISHVKSSSIHK